MTGLVRCYHLPLGSDETDGRTFPDGAPPFVWSATGTYCHRIRSLTLWEDTTRGPSIMTWCGQLRHIKRSGRASEIGFAVPDGHTECGTCHGRAVGAGQIDDNGSPLIFTPVVETWLGQCIWQHPGASMSREPWRCRKRATVPLDGAPQSHVAGLCGQHSRQWPPTPQWRLDDSLRYAGLMVEQRIIPIP